MAEVLDIICNKRKLSNPKDYALVVDMNPMKILIPLDRTVKSLQGKRDLVLIKKNMLQHYGVEISKGRAGRSTDPNGKQSLLYMNENRGNRTYDGVCLASIFKRNSEVPEVYSSVFDYTTAYKVRCVIKVVLNRNTDLSILLAVYRVPQGTYVGWP